MISRKQQQGRLAANSRIFVPTSGTFGLGVAMVAAARGLNMTAIVDEGLEPAILDSITSYGALIETVPTPADGNRQMARLEKLGEIIEGEPDPVFIDQYNSQDNPRSYQGLAAELLRDLPHIDTVVASVGTGGHSSGIAGMLRQTLPRLKVVGVDAVGSQLFGQPKGDRLSKGYGNDIFPKNVDYGLYDEVHWVSDAEAATTARELETAYPEHSGGWSVGAVALVARWQAHQNPDHNVVAIFPDGTSRYQNTIYDDGFTAQHGLIVNTPATPVLVTDPTQRVTAWSRTTTIRNPAPDKGPRRT